jgi:hypothetical protein
VNVGVVVEDPGTVELPAVVEGPPPATVEEGVELDDVAPDDGVELEEGVELEDVAPVGAAVDDALPPGIEGPAEVDDPGAVEAGADELLAGADEEDELDDPAVDAVDDAVVDDVWAETAPLLIIAAQPAATAKNAPPVRSKRAVGRFDMCT